MGKGASAARMVVVTVYHGRRGSADFVGRPQYLLDAIHSVEREEPLGVIHLVIDDGSTDDAIAMAKEKYPASQFRHYFRREKVPGEPLSSTNARNLGICICIANQIPGITLTPSDYITFLDSDDLAIDLIGRLSYAQSNQLDFLVTDCLIFMDHDIAYKWECSEGPLDNIRQNFWIRGEMPYPTMTWRLGFLRSLQDFVRDTYGRSGLFDGSIGCGEDVDVAYISIDCVRHQGARFGYWKRVTAAYRIHDTSLAVIRNQRRRRQEENAVLLRHNGWRGRCTMHFRRLLFRPECYIGWLGFLVSRRKTPYLKSDYVGERVRR